MTKLKQQDSREYCSTTEAADLLGVAPKTIQVWVEAGALEAWKTVGGHRRIVMSSIERMLAERGNPLPANVERTKQARGHKVLIVDDDPTLLRAYEIEMASWDMSLQILKAQDGFDAMLQIGHHEPDLLISDLSMTGMDGFRMISRLHNNPAAHDMRIIVVTGLDPTTVRLLSLPDAIPVLPKPVQFPRLQALVAEMLAA